MNEIKLLSVLLSMALGAAYFTWRAEQGADGKQKVTIFTAPPEELTRVTLATQSATVSLERRVAADGARYFWFDVESNQQKRSFLGNAEVSKLVASLTTFRALRSFGTLIDDEEWGRLSKEQPSRGRLLIELARGPRRFEVGGRTFGGGDYYVRPEGQLEVFLVASKLLNQLEYPESSLMQRRLRLAELKDVTSVVLRTGEREGRLLHQNAVSSDDAFWASSEKPDQRSETAENYMLKIEGLSVERYLPSEQPLEGAEVFLEVGWYAGEKLLDTLRLSQAGAGSDATYSAVSGATRFPTQISRELGAQLRRDLPSVLGGEH